MSQVASDGELIIRSYGTGGWMGDGVYEVCDPKQSIPFFCSVKELKKRRCVKRIDQSIRAQAYFNTLEGRQWLIQETNQYNVISVLHNRTQKEIRPAYENEWIQVIDCLNLDDRYRPGYIFKVSSREDKSGKVNLVEPTQVYQNKDAELPCIIPQTNWLLDSQYVVLIADDSSYSSIDQILEFQKSITVFARELAEQISEKSLLRNPQ